jgi:RNA polymerase sigma factor (sigma-70 family)
MVDSKLHIEELEALYRRRYVAFVRVASAIAGEPARGADAVHDAFANAIAALDSYRGEAPLEAWVWRIVVRAAASTRLHKERTADALVPEANGDAPIRDESVRKLVAALPERQRLAIFLRYFADLDYRGIALVLGIEVGTVLATLNAAHAALRRMLEEVRP